MANKLKTFSVLLADKDEIPGFLYSCAATEVLFKDMKIITESTGLLCGMGYLLTGGSAQRVGGTLSENDRRVLAVAAYHKLLKQYTATFHDPVGQANFLVNLERHRDAQRRLINYMFTDVEAYNANADAALYTYAKTARSVQAVACIALVTLATGGGFAVASGSSTMLGMGMTGGYVATTSGTMLVTVLGTKAIIAGAQGGIDMKSLWGFAVGTLQQGVPTLGELSAKAFELVKDAAVKFSANNMCVAMNGYAHQINETKERIAELQKAVWRDMNAAKNSNYGASLRQAAMRSATANKAEIARLEQEIQTMLKGNVARAGNTGKFMKMFGGKAVPIVCLATDALIEWNSVTDFNQDLNKSGMRQYQPSH